MRLDRRALLLAPLPSLVPIASPKPSLPHVARFDPVQVGAISSVSTARRIFAQAPAPAPPRQSRAQQHLYYIPPPNSRVWESVRHPRAAAATTRRVLASHNTEGFVLSEPDASGTYRVYDWSHLPDLLFFNPFEYFYRNPTIHSLWIERVDPSVRVRYVTDPTDVDPTPVALVLLRSELTCELCESLADHQLSFFVANNLVLPDASEFTATLHGR